MRQLHVLIACFVSVRCELGSAGDAAASKEGTGIRPELVPESDKKFFGKDYPWDRRPAVDVLHFKHPYPVVQDSGDYDRDFVKDENSDNGEFAAQSEYDRLRHKLRKQKADVAKALGTKQKAEEELQAAMKRHQDAHERAEAAERARRAATTTKPVHEQMQDAAKKWFGPAGGETPTDAPYPGPGDIDTAANDVKRSMDALDECKKQLAEARERLKKLLKELEEAKKKQVETEASEHSAEDHQKQAEDDEKNYKKSVDVEYQEYLKAREEYLKQQAEIARMEHDIEVAAQKVKAFRDAEDADGGVYNKRGAKSKATTSAFSGIALLVLAAACGSWSA